jgi:hypothetical protein
MRTVSVRIWSLAASTTPGATDNGFCFRMLRTSGACGQLGGGGFEIDNEGDNLRRDLVPAFGAARPRQQAGEVANVPYFRSQPLQLAPGQRVAQHLLDAPVVALSGCPDGGDDVGGQSEPDPLLGADHRRASELFPSLVLLGENLLERPGPGEVLGESLADDRLAHLTGYAAQI